MINNIIIERRFTELSKVSINSYFSGKCGGTLKSHRQSYPYDNFPDFAEPLKNITVQMGRNATFTCHVNGILNTPYRVSRILKEINMILSG